ncbi:MAG: tetratricopeptide repeat protein [Geitlerinemataceae cyanobacterium]
MYDRPRFLIFATTLLSGICSLSPLTFTWETFQLETLAVQAQTLEAGKAQADRLLAEGIAQYNEIKFGEAIAKFEEALSIYQEIGEMAGVGNTFHQLGLVYNSLQDYDRALDYYQQALTIQRGIGYFSLERVILYRIGKVYERLRDDRQALDYYQQALAVSATQCGDRIWEGIALAGMGRVYQKQEEYRQALDYYQQAVAIREEEIDCTDEKIPGSSNRASTLFKNIGFVSQQLEEYPQALDYYQKALEIFREIGDQDEEWLILNEMGVVYRRLGEYQQAIDSFQQSMAIQQNSLGFVEGLTLHNLGLVYDNLAEYQQALDYYQQAIEIARGFGDREDESVTLTNMGTVYRKLGEYQRAIDYYQQALLIVREVGDRQGEGAILNNSGAVYQNLGEYQQAIDYFQPALTIAREIENKALEGRILNNTGESYRQLEESQQAIDSYQQAWEILREIGDPAGTGSTLNNMGLVYESLGEYPQAIDRYQQALGIFREIGDKAATGTTLRNIGYLMELQNKPELAILFFKQSVNTREQIRESIEELSLEFQQSYTDTIAEDYRHLADLFLQSDRLLEAQRVLDLLKVQELDDYFGNVRGNDNTTQGLPNLYAEQQTWDGYQLILDEAVEIGKELTQLRQKNNRNLVEEHRLAQLVNAQEIIIEDFNTFIASEEVEALISQLTPETRKPDLVDDLEDFLSIQDNLKALQQNAVLFYPLILDDRLELILTTPDSPPIRRTVNVSKEELAETILAFRQALNRPRSDAKILASQLYNWLIQPLENDLKAAEAETIIYAPDGQLRYIPLAALYDGNRWLVERYRINNITATSLTDLDTQPRAQMKVLAGAFTTGQYNLIVGEESFNFSGLPYAGVEVEILAETIPNTIQLINDAFSPQETKPKMGDHTVLHFATHGAIAIGSPEDSFILFGDGTPVTIAEVRNWNLNHVDLVVLSACVTGLGGNLGTGAEILGLGYQMQRAGARAAIASLWAVNDGGTQVLMNGFYRGLQGGMTKAEALRQAQIALITGEYTAVGEDRGIAIAPILDNLPRQGTSGLSHPYYWAPFILIGNGL